MIYPANRYAKTPEELVLTTLPYTQDPAVEDLQNPFVLNCRLQLHPEALSVVVSTLEERGLMRAPHTTDQASYP
jgi:hypothetical protein